MNDTAAIIVTYNRVSLLLECIEALINQKNKTFDIIVIDNASTDDTFERLSGYKKSEQIIYYNTGCNLGGAGGFNFGLHKAYEAGYTYYWMMDDDTIPNVDAFNQLVNASSLLNNNFGFLCSLVNWTDGSICKMNQQTIDEDWLNETKYFEHGLIKVSKATFVSFYTQKKIIEEVGFPIKEFFIWSDDTNYCMRINKIAANFLVLNSVVTHKITVNCNADIIDDESNRLQRYKYAFRNRYYNARMEGKILKYYLYIIKKMILILRLSRDKKFRRIYFMLQGAIQGPFFSPKIEYPDNK